jgi:hypothetical protein
MSGAGVPGPNLVGDPRADRLPGPDLAGDPVGYPALALLSAAARAYTATNLGKGKTIAETAIGSFPSCPIPELARLGRTPARGTGNCWPTSPPRASPTAAPKL